MTPGDIQIRPWADVIETPGMDDAVDRIFFEASNRQSFASAAERAEFRTLWLGHFVETFPDLACVAVGARGTPLGYIVASDLDPRRDRALGELTYFAVLGDLLDRYPAHLHINVDGAARGFGIGQHLIAWAVTRLRRRGAPGLHVMTGAASRNVTFYERAAFQPAATVPWRERRLLCLTRDL
ncbi:MAG: GNAT family N-acetyltransferase [Pseudomonadota bacterium]